MKYYQIQQEFYYFKIILLKHDIKYGIQIWYINIIIKYDMKLWHKYMIKIMIKYDIKYD